MRQPRAPRAADATFVCSLVIRRQLFTGFVLFIANYGPLEADQPPPEPLRLELRLRTGGTIGGRVVDHNENGLILLSGDTPHVFAWRELEPRSAYASRRTLLASQRGGQEGLAADDQMVLGEFALTFHRNDLAATHFREAVRLDPSYRPRVDAIFQGYRRQREASATGRSEAAKPAVPPESGSNSPAARPDFAAAELITLPAWEPVEPVPLETAAHIAEIYLTFGETVRRVVSKSIALVETEHFLIWTDWDRRQHARLADWCERMYAAMVEEFQLDAAHPLFPARCPVFAFRARPRFREFARKFDGFDARNSIGYTRSIEENGHVHVVLLRTGDSEIDFDQFGVTLVHELTHAFVHRLHSTRLIPHWVNEGLADRMAERVLGEHCFTRENAELLARYWVRSNRSLAGLLASEGPIEVHEYPLAHGVVAHLYDADAAAFLAFFRGLKEGRNAAEALADAYAGLTLEELEMNWRRQYEEPARTTAAQTVP
jgi:hypothetical protein